MALVIRDADARDASGLAPLLEALGYPADVATIADRLRTLAASDPAGRIIVAVDDERLVGFATLHSTPVLHRPAAVGRITGIAVDPHARAHGVGRALVR